MIFGGVRNVKNKGELLPFLSQDSLNGFGLRIYPYWAWYGLPRTRACGIWPGMVYHTSGRRGKANILFSCNVRRGCAFWEMQINAIAFEGLYPSMGVPVYARGMGNE